MDTVGTPAFSVALEWQSPNWGSTESSRVRVAPGPSHVLPTKTRSTSSHQRHIHSDLPCLSMARRLLIGLLAGRAVSLLGVSLWCSLSWLLVSGSVFGFTTIPYIHPPEANTYVALLPKSILCGVFPGQIENELGAESARKLHAALFRCLPSTP